MAEKWGELNTLSKSEVERRYNQTAKHTQVGLGFYHSELVRRMLRDSSEEQIRLTKHIRLLTVVITLLTICNVAFVGMSIFT